MYTNPDFLQKGEEFNAEYANLRLNKTEYDAFITNTNNAKWKVFKNDFLEFTHRCPICEAHIDNYASIDHYRPKNYYWWLGYDYKNYVILCNHCNSSLKRTSFPLFNEAKKITFATKDRMNEEEALLFNPMSDNPEELFQLCFKMNSKGKEFVEVQPLASLDLGSYEYAKAVETIDVFKLNDQKNKNKFSIMVDNSSALIPLAHCRYKYLKKPTPKNKKILFRQMKSTIGNMKIGLAALVLKGQFIWNLP